MTTRGRDVSGRIVLGLGGTVDYETHWDAAVVQRLVDGYGITAAELEDPPSSRVADEREMVLTVLRSMWHAQGCESYVADKAALLAFGDRFDHEVTLGGTCVRAALAMARIGVESTVHLVSINDDVRRLLPPAVEWVCSAEADSLDPHVIVQYPEGAEVRLADAVVRADRPNRVILVNDVPNERLRLSGELPRLLASARTVLISGFNTMKSDVELRDRLDEVAAALRHAPQDATVIYEDAGFHDDAMRDVVLETIPGLVDLHSLNEDEAQRYLGHDVDLDDPRQVSAMMARLREILRAPAVMVHTSRYVAVVGRRAPSLAKAAEAGCLMAATRFVHGDCYGRDEYAAVEGAPRQAVGLRLAAAPQIASAGVVIAPGAEVAAETPTTIGLGDAFIGGVVAHLAGGAPENRG